MEPLDKVWLIEVVRKSDEIVSISGMGFNMVREEFAMQIGLESVAAAVVTRVLKTVEFRCIVSVTTMIKREVGGSGPASELTGTSRLVVTLEEDTARLVSMEAEDDILGTWFTLG